MFWLAFGCIRVHWMMVVAAVVGWFVCEWMTVDDLPFWLLIIMTSIIRVIRNNKTNRHTLTLLLIIIVMHACLFPLVCLFVADDEMLFGCICM